MPVFFPLIVSLFVSPLVCALVGKRFLGAARLTIVLGALLAGSFSAVAAPAPFQDSIAQRALACTGCHGPEGRSAPDGYYPRIAGKPTGYLYNQLLNFREGRRHYSPMTRLIDHLGDAYLQELAGYFAQLELPYARPAAAPASSAAALQHGERLAREGDAGRQLPACTRCHGLALTGVAPAVPGLLGLPRDYLAAQMGAWQTGQRRAHAPDCMASVARALEATDISALSTWLAAQPVPAAARAVSVWPTGSAPDCGSLRSARP